MAVRKAGDEGGNFLTEKRIVKLLVVTMLVVCCWSPAALAACGWGERRASSAR